MPRIRRAASCPRPAGWCKYRPPAEGPHDGITVRNDTGVYEGGEISIYYDPMIAKLVTHAGDRLTRDRGAGATRSTPSSSTASATTSRSSSALMQHERWRAGRLSTGFIAEEYPDGFTPLDAGGRDRACAWRRSPRIVDHRPQRAQAPDFRADARRRSRCASSCKRVGAARRDARSTSRSTPRDGGARRRVRRRRARIARRIRRGRRASRCGAATSTASRSRCRCAPILNGFAIAHARRRGRGARLHAPRGRARRADARAQGRRHCRSRCSARCRAWSRRSRSRKARR